MILDVPGLVARHCQVPDATARELRAAYIRTTSPTFLIFAPHQEHPFFVVKVDKPGTLERAHAMATRLHQLMPSATARPYGVFPLADAAAMSVQDGLPGLPWFRLSDHLTTKDDWLALRDRCIQQLREFQQAVAAEPAWVVPAARFDEALATLETGVRDLLAPLGADVQRLIEESVRTLAALGPVRAQWQHGDFVVNNLLVDRHRLAIVDLVDFGKWQVPFLDASALACSFNLQARSHVDWHHLAVDLAACAAAEAGASGFSPHQRASFFVFYLLSAITDTLHLSSRAAIRLTYLELLRDVAADPAAFEGAFR